MLKNYTASEPPGRLLNNWGAGYTGSGASVTGGPIWAKLGPNAHSGEREIEARTTSAWVLTTSADGVQAIQTFFYLQM